GTAGAGIPASSAFGVKPSAFGTSVFGTGAKAAAAPAPAQAPATTGSSVFGKPSSYVFGTSFARQAPAPADAPASAPAAAQETMIEEPVAAEQPQEPGEASTAEKVVLLAPPVSPSGCTFC